jgi:uncharacterized membrane protein (Fun14 family)
MVAQPKEEHARDQRHPHEKRKRGDRWFLFLILSLFVVGLSIRGYGYLTGTGTNNSVSRKSAVGTQSPSTFRETPSGGDSRALRPVDTSPAGGTDWVAELAPYLTEGGVSFFLGFCLGYFLRVVAKTAAFVIGAMYIGLILLSHYGLISVDWGSIQQLVQQLLLNTRSQVEGLQGLLTVGLPSVAMGGLGIWRGLKKP